MSATGTVRGGLAGTECGRRIRCRRGRRDLDGDAGAGPKPNETPNQKRGGRQPLARHLKRERIVHDLAEAEKHCDGCGKDLRLIARRDQRTLRIHSRVDEGDRGRLAEVRLRLHGEDREQAAATDREEHGGSELVGASDRGEMGRSSAAAPAGEDVRAAWRRDLAQDHGRLDGAVRGTARSSVPVDEEGAVELQGDRHRRYQREGAGPETSLCQDRADLAVCRRCSPSGDRVRLHARRERAPARRNFWKDTKGICRRTPTPSTMHFSSPNAG